MRAKSRLAAGNANALDIGDAFALGLRGGFQLLRRDEVAGPRRVTERVPLADEQATAPRENLPRGLISSLVRPRRGARKRTYLSRARLVLRELAVSVGQIQRARRGYSRG